MIDLTDEFKTKECNISRWLNPFCVVSFIYQNVGCSEVYHNKLPLEPHALYTRAPPLYCPILLLLFQ